MSHSQKVYADDLLFHLFLIVAPLPHGLKITRLTKMHTPRIKSSLSEVNFSPNCINTLVHILMDSMVNSPVYSAVLNNIITYNTKSHMVASFFCY